MLSVAIQTLLALISGLLPLLGVGSSSVVAEIIAALEAIVPIIAANAQNFLAPVQAIIATLSGSGLVTAAQMATLRALDAQVDSAFEAAANAAGYPNPAPPLAL